MSRVVYPIDRATMLSTDLAAKVIQSEPCLISGAHVHDETSLRGFCESRRIQIVYKELPADRTAAIIDVEGTPFIVLNPRLQDDRIDRSFILGHEIAHAVLGHLTRHNFGVAGYAETINRSDYWLQVAYSSEQELQADLLSMMMVIPDDFLHQEVDDHVYISAMGLASKHGLSVKVTAARIELYRKVYGYKRSQEVLKKREGCDFSLSPPRLKEGEMPQGAAGLAAFLPVLSPEVARLIGVS